MSKILVAGATGLAGRGIVRLAKNKGYSEIIEISSKNCDLTNPLTIRDLINDIKPDLVVDAAAKVGGIFAERGFNLTDMAQEIKAIKAKDSNAVIHCWGGDLMEAAGGKLVKHYKQYYKHKMLQ